MSLAAEGSQKVNPTQRNGLVLIVSPVIFTSLQADKYKLN